MGFYCVDIDGSFVAARWSGGYGYASFSNGEIRKYNAHNFILEDSVE